MTMKRKYSETRSVNNYHPVIHWYRREAVAVFKMAMSVNQRIVRVVLTTYFVFWLA
jgi:hypothetical protein